MCVAAVKAVYKDLNLEQLYKDTETESYARLTAMIESKCEYVPKKVFLDFAKKIYFRHK